MLLDSQQIIIGQQILL